MRTLAVTRRVLQGFRRDHRTVALMLAAPCVILTFLWLVFDGDTYEPNIAAVDLPPPLLQALEEQDATVEVMKTAKFTPFLLDPSTHNRIFYKR